MAQGAQPSYLTSARCIRAGLWGIVVYLTIAIVGIVLLLVGALGGIIAALFYVLFFALGALGGVLVTFPLFIIGLYVASKFPEVQKLADKVQHSLKAKSLTEVEDAIRSSEIGKSYLQKNNGQDLQLGVDVLREEISLNFFWVNVFIVGSSADITTDTYYASATTFMNPIMEFVVVLFLLLPMIVLFVQHQLRMGQAWLKTEDGRDLKHVRRVFESDWKFILMPFFPLASITTFWIVLTYRFAVIMGRVFVAYAFGFIKLWYGKKAGESFAQHMGMAKFLPASDSEKRNTVEEGPIRHKSQPVRAVSIKTVRKSGGRWYAWGSSLRDVFFAQPYSALQTNFAICRGREDAEPQAPICKAIAAPFMMLLGLVPLAFFVFGALVFTIFFLTVLFFVWPTLWIIASALASVCAAFGPSLLSAVYALCMHLKLFAHPYAYPFINRLEALTLWLVAVCTSSYRKDGIVLDNTLQLTAALKCDLASTRVRVWQMGGRGSKKRPASAPDTVLHTQP